MSWTYPPDGLTPMNRPVAGRATAPTTAAHESAPPDDHQLVEAVRAYLACLAGGTCPSPAQAAAWDAFYRTYAPVVVGLAEAWSGAAGPADDEVQVVWQVVVSRLASFRPDPARGPFRAWLMIVARRRLIDRHRGDARRLHAARWDEPPVHLAGREPDPAVACEREDERAFASALLARLRGRVSPLSYRVLHLRSIDELAVAEVARLVGLTDEQVRVRHHRMLGQLRRLAGLGDRGPRKNPKSRATSCRPSTC